jgi:hypothetical protein
MMLLSTAFVAFALLSRGFRVLAADDLAEDLVREDRIKVFLYAAPAFWQEVGVDAYKDICTNLGNNLYVSLDWRPYMATDNRQYRWKSTVDPDWWSRRCCRIAEGG